MALLSLCGVSLYMIPAPPFWWGPDPAFHRVQQQAQQKKAVTYVKNQIVNVAIQIAATKT
jgi:hypothetical protein